VANASENPSPTFKEELQNLINRFYRESGSNTPDFILADYLSHALEAFDKAVLERDNWYGRSNGINDNVG
jgi:hypothetical protein